MAKKKLQKFSPTNPKMGKKFFPTNPQMGKKFFPTNPKMGKKFFPTNPKMGKKFFPTNPKSEVKILGKILGRLRVKSRFSGRRRGENAMDGRIFPGRPTLEHLDAPRPRGDNAKRRVFNVQLAFLTSETETRASNNRGQAYFWGWLIEKNGQKQAKEIKSRCF